MNDLVYLIPNTEEPFTTSEVIAECAEVKHDTVQKLIQRHEAAGGVSCVTSSASSVLAR